MNLLELLAERYPIENTSWGKDLLGYSWSKAILEKEDWEVYIEFELIESTVVEVAHVLYLRDFVLDKIRLDARDPRFFDQLEEKLDEWDNR